MMLASRQLAWAACWHAGLGGLGGLGGLDGRAASRGDWRSGDDDPRHVLLAGIAELPALLLGSADLDLRYVDADGGAVVPRASAHRLRDRPGAGDGGAIRADLPLRAVGRGRRRPARQAAGPLRDAI